MKTRLQAVRREAGFKSAKEFAAHLGMSPNTYTAFEQGRHMYNLEQACIFADALGEAMGRHVSLDELAGREWPRMEASLTPEERELLGLYRDSNAQGQSTIVGVARLQPGVEGQDEAREVSA